MAKRKSEFEMELDSDLEGWIAVRKIDNPVGWEAWTKWRRANVNSLVDHDNLTVPTEFPPTTVEAAEKYLDIVKRIRKLIGWTGERARVSSDPTAWMG